ncbi:hypothetical protein CPX_001777 [Candidatus Phytoplasma pruni]|uniref:Uncharacterized protein n=1 Tax=Candidatus Phytoplasma pruni TaxID=479893 RepID=A0A0M1MZM3_9MOLU|nr:hypothetical protein CPX_001777 [Candidatus Phytoplasma pruni]
MISFRKGAIAQKKGSDFMIKIKITVINNTVIIEIEPPPRFYFFTQKNVIS